MGACFNMRAREKSANRWRRVGRERSNDLHERWEMRRKRTQSCRTVASFSCPALC